MLETPASNNPKQNRILAELVTNEYARLQDDLELVTLTLGAQLCDAGDTLDYVYFPITGIISLSFTTRNGASVELAMIGNEGLVGMPLVLGGLSTNHRVVVQSPGAAYRLKVEVIRWELDQGGGLQHLALRHTQALMTQMAQSVVCNRHHSIDQQLCRWLLLSLDRLPGLQIHMTQELIASFLGVRREAITEAAGKLQLSGLIQYRRGYINILDRAGLAARACECYGVVKAEYDRLFQIVPENRLRSRTRPNPESVRSRAEARWRQTPPEIAKSPWDNAQLLHELQVHQIELEMHNEALRHAYDEADALRDRYADIYDFAPVSYFTLNRDGVILDLNLSGAILLGVKGSQKSRHRFAAFVCPGSLDAFNQFREEQPCPKSSLFWVPCCIIFQHCIHDSQELSHTSDDHHFGWFSGLFQAIRKGLNRIVAPHSRDGRHIQHRPYIGPPTPNEALTPMFATVVRQWRHARQRCNLATIECAQFWTLRQHRQTGHRTYARDGAQQIVLGAPDIRFAQLLVQITIDFNNLFVQPDNVFFQTLLQRLGSRRTQSERFLNPHRNQLASPAHHVVERTGVRVFKRTHLRTNGASKVSQHGGIHFVCLGQPSGGFGEVSRLARIDDRHRQMSGGQFAGQMDLQATSGFQHDQGRAGLFQQRDDLTDTGVIIGHVHGLSRGRNADVQGGFGHINANKFFHRALVHTHPCKMRAYWPKQPFGLLVRNQLDAPCSPTGLVSQRAIELSSRAKQKTNFSSLLIGKRSIQGLGRGGF
ncbi:MAG: hypothetical protein RLZZ298_318 [Pseudomonadota bacterium]